MVKTSDFESGNSGSRPGEAARPPNYKIMLNDFGHVLWTHGSAPEEIYKGEVDMPSPRRTVTTTLLEWEESFSCPLVKFIEELEAVLLAAPKADRSILKFNFDRHGDDYDYSRGEMSVYSERLESDDELEQRLRREMTSKLQEEARSRREYERLKGIFGK